MSELRNIEPTLSSPRSPEQTRINIQRIPEFDVLNLRLAHLGPRVHTLNQLIEATSLAYMNWVTNYENNPLAIPELTSPEKLSQENNPFRKYIENLVVDLEDLTALQLQSSISHNEVANKYKERLGNNLPKTTKKKIYITTEAQLKDFEERWYAFIHDIRNPLTSLNGSTSLMKFLVEGKLKNPSIVENTVEFGINRQIRKMYNLLNTIPEILQLKYKKQNIPSEQIYQGIVENFLLPLQENPKPALKGLIIKIPTQIPEELRGLKLIYDESLLFDQLLPNFVQNIERSFEKRPEKRPHATNDPKEVKVSFAISGKGSFVDIIIEDTGSGFDEGILDRNGLFTGQSGLGGQGRGMKFHQEVASYMGGEIIADSIPPKTYDPTKRTGALVILRLLITKS